MKKCMVDNCNTLTKRKFYCDKHYKRWKRHGDPCKKLIRDVGDLNISCSVNGCMNDATNNLKTDIPMCPKHYVKWLKYKDPTYTKIAPKGSGWVNNKGYRLITINGKNKMYHRHIMELFIGRKLLKNEYVHHKNGNKLDNNIENLELWSSTHPSGQRIEDLTEWAINILKLYNPTLLKASEMLMEEPIETKLDKMMDDKNLKVEVKDKNGRWIDIKQYGVHINHCCVKHGCKYMEEDCPVVTGIVEQACPCEDCEED